MSTVAQPVPTTAEKTTKPDFGSGRYSNMMDSIFESAQVVFKLSSKAAEKLARQAGSDYGAAMRNAPVEAKVGKSLSKDGKITLSEAAKVKGITATNSIIAMRALQYASDAGKYHIGYSTTQWKATGVLAEYFASLEQ